MISAMVVSNSCMLPLSACIWLLQKQRAIIWTRAKAFVGAKGWIGCCYMRILPVHGVAQTVDPSAEHTVDVQLLRGLALL